MEFATESAIRVGPRDHVVLFYDSEPELADLVAEYLAPALTQGHATVVLATPEHRVAFATRLRQAGVDLEAARADGSYRDIDAAATLDRFMTGGWPDPFMFWAEISPLLRQAAERGQQLRIFGEMVALLWHRGQVDVSIDVEAMWNELALQYEFALACAYPAAAARDPAHADAVEEVCRAHAMVVGQPPPASRGWRYH